MKQLNSGGFVLSDILSNTTWIQVIASGLIAHIAILSIIKDPVTKHPLMLIEDF